MIPPSQNPDGWNKMIVAAVPSPGTVVLSNLSRAIGWDVKNADGQKGASTSRKGQPVGKFDATFYLTDDPADGEVTDFERWDGFEALLFVSVEGAEAWGLEVVHPDLNRLGYTAIVLDKMGQVVHDKKGGGSVKVSFLEYRPPSDTDTGGPTQTKTATPGGGGGGGSDGGGPG